MAKISIMTMAFGEELASGKLDDVAMLAGLQEIGFDGVELTSPRLMEGPEIQHTYRSNLAESSLEVTCLDVMCTFVSANPATRDKGVEALLNGIELAQSMGARLVLAAGSTLGDGIVPEDGRKMVAEALLACMADARDAGITLAIENFGVAPTLQCASGHCLEILDAVPGLAFVFDTGNFYFCGEDPLDAFEKLADRTVYVHIKDWTRSTRPVLADVAGCHVGEGIIPNEAIIAKFLESSSVDTFSLELTVARARMAAAERGFAVIRNWTNG
ncbi:MAG TPA: sugar phosphate isomerase/epimerase family protein [Candidatus Hydrogenedentes bacterium]|nr:sugar phosphate isomerase/epimerase family protein [Candidatus Hydrogenedentota bacterium]HQE82112.1 sugar phosphate isomerase/epimerase family protein [Candidatus Hydrogenedentota bacterium]HQH52058.1 sugar phosphate isomerase/epimerase family protein [Candidatus Hydrogenedentota bacterium]HQM49746.1 sugar phosphate isomerase/epimerase family protein [Candidatus Hydrogenedentota bacterium]